MGIRSRKLVKLASVILLCGFTISAGAEVEHPFHIEEPEFDLKISGGGPEGIRIQGDIRKGSSILGSLGLNTLNYDSRFPQAWAWVDPANPLLLTLNFPGGGHQQVNLGLNEVTKLKLHYENSTYAIAAGAWLTVSGIRELAGELKPIDIQIKVTDRYGGYLDMAEQPGGRIEVLVNDAHPRNLPPAGRDLAPKIQQVVLRPDLRPEVTILTPFPNLEWSTDDGNLVKMASFINMKMAGPAGRASVVLGSMDGVTILNRRQQHDSLSGFDDTTLYVYLPKSHVIAAAIGEVTSGRTDGLTTPKLVLKITGKVERTNISDFGRAESFLLKGQKDPFITVDFEQSYSIPFFRFQGDVKVEAIPYDASLFDVGGCESQAKKP